MLLAALVLLVLTYLASAALPASLTVVRTSLVAFSLFASTGLLCATEQVNGYYQATAYAQHGITASGEYAHRHVVAADPDILPIGSRIKIQHAGRDDVPVSVFAAGCNSV